MNNGANELMNVDELLETFQAQIVDLYGSMDAMYADWEVEEMEMLDFLEEDEEFDLVFNS